MTRPFFDLFDGYRQVGPGPEPDITDVERHFVFEYIGLEHEYLRFDRFAHRSVVDIVDDPDHFHVPSYNVSEFQAVFLLHRAVDDQRAFRVRFEQVGFAEVPAFGDMDAHEFQKIGRNGECVKVDVSVFIPSSPAHVVVGAAQ